MESISDKLVCHKCDNRSCVNPNHLFLGTQKDNMNDMISKGREFIPDNTGAKNGRAILKESDVRNIRMMLNNKSKTIKELAIQYKVHRRTIEHIRVYKLWKHI